MRAAATLILLVAAPAVAGAAPCSWIDHGFPPLFAYSGIAVLQRELTCPADARGSVRVELSAFAGTNEVALDAVEAKIEPRHKWPQQKKLTEKIARSQYCKAEPKKRSRLRLVGYGSDQRLVYDVAVRAEATGTGDLASLKWSGETTVTCDACPRKSGDIALKDGRAHATRISKKTRISASADRAWYDCVKKGSTLALRFFATTETQKALDAIRPVFALEKLEKRFSTKGGKAELDEPVPVAKLCRAVGAGTHDLVWEVFGDGELMRIGPGRSRIKITCP
jgi:hypothetical protein